MVAMQLSGTFLSSPEGSLRSARPFSLAISCAMLPALLASCAPLPGYSSTLCTKVPTGILTSGSALPGLISAEGPDTNFLAEGYHTEASTVVEEGVEHTVYTVKKD